MKPTEYLEIEAKLYVPNLDLVARKLSDLGAPLIAPRVFERNVRYENTAHTLTEQGIVVRLRQDSRVRLTYKEPLQAIVEDFAARFEAEVEVDDFDAMQLILAKLGYHPHLIYEKYRTTYQLDDTEIVLDELPYGNFVEVEGAPDAITSVIQQLNLESATHFTTNYVTLFDNVKRNLGLSMNDLTFNNFEGINVPASAFDFS
jgi:adenylate cyclase class 2